ncbi:MAG: tetratricopeptide repeat protein, partial [Candidatus Sericytochromatia bacterium]
MHNKELYNEALIELKQGKYTQALSKFEELLNSEQDNFQIYFQIASCYSALENYDEAINNYK